MLNDTSSTVIDVGLLSPTPCFLELDKSIRHACLLISSFESSNSLKQTLIVPQKLPPNILPVVKMVTALRTVLPTELTSFIAKLTYV